MQFAHFGFIARCSLLAQGPLADGMVNELAGGALEHSGERRRCTFIRRYYWALLALCQVTFLSYILGVCAYEH